MIAPKILNFESMTLEIVFDGKIDRNKYDLGALRMEREGRSYILDVIQSNTFFENGGTTITCGLDVDTETFPIDEYMLYDLREDDFYFSDFKASLYIGTEYSKTPEHITLSVRRDNSTKVINVELE